MRTFLQYIEDNYPPQYIRGEFWIFNGSVQFADGDVGDYNHEGLAIQHVFSAHIENIVDLAEELGLEAAAPDNFGDIDTEAASEIVHQIFSQNNNEQFIMGKLNVNRECLHILMGGGDAVSYVMQYENWIAVRGNNIELFGYNDNKRKSLLSGLEEILDSEGIENVPSEQIELTIHDHKTNQSSYLTLADIEHPVPVMRPTQPLMTKMHSKFNVTNSDKVENMPQTTKGKIDPKANQWRNTSEALKH